MFSFLRTSRSLWKSRRSQNPDLRFYRVTFTPYLSPRRWSRPIVAVGLVGGFVYYNSDILEKSFAKGPVYIPLWFASSSTAPLYEVDGPEHRDYTELMKDVQRRVDAEGVVLNAVKKRIMASSLNMGQWEGFASPFWMTFRLAAPGVTWSRKNLAISFSGIELVDRPVSSRNVMRFNCIVYPRAAALTIQATIGSMYNSIRQSVWSGESAPVPKPTPFRKTDTASDPSKKEQRMDVPLLPSGAIMAIHEAAEKGASTMFKELARDYQKNVPPPPRGWIVADGTVRLVGTELALILDFRVAFNPKNFEQNFVYELNPRHHSPRGNMSLHTFEKPGLPPPRPSPKQKQKQPQQQQQRQIPEREEQQQPPPSQSPRETESIQKPAVSVETPTVPEEQQQQQQPQGGPRPQQAEQEVPRKR